MRRLFSSIAMVAFVASFATSNPSPAAARGSASWDGTIHCSQPGAACVSTSARNYNGCIDLSLRRGYNLGGGGRRYLDLFVYQCLAGRVPR
jgi:hypothetical protein